MNVFTSKVMCSHMSKSSRHLLASLATLLTAIYAYSADVTASESLEEVIVVGSQIKGASISDVLPVSVFSADDIEAMGIESGDELIENMAEMGRNEFNDAGSTSGSINSSRGDIGAYNLRNLGV